MATANRTFRSNMLLSTAIAALVATPGAVKAQLVNNVDVDLNSAFDPGGVGGPVGAGADSALGIANDPGLPNSATLTVKRPVVVASWNRFNVLTGTVLNVTNDSGAATSTLVNRVIGPTASNISGTINSTNVNFWLLNQNGIAFGSGARVNMTGASFLASTLDVDRLAADPLAAGPAAVAARFQPGAALAFDNGSGAALTTGPLNVEFRSDGSMMFLSPRLNLNATFEAGGQIAFVTGADVDVNFTPGSPLTFTVQAGTTVARGQTVAGSVKGKSVVFDMETAAGITNALLRVDARVEATEAVATQSGILLSARSVDTPTNVVLKNDLVTAGGKVSIAATGNLTASNPITGGDISINTFGSTAVDDLTATRGGITVFSRDLTVRTGVLSATGGDVLLGALGNISTQQITARSLRGTGGAVDIASSTGRLALSGVLDAQGQVTLGAQGSLTGTGIVTTGDVVIGQAVTPSSIRLTGDVTAASIDARTTGGFNSTALTARTGNISVVADSIVTTTVNALQSNVLLEATGRGITTDAVSAGPRSPFTGTLTIRSLAGGTLNLGDLAAGSNITLNTTGTLSAGSATSKTGTLTVGATSVPGRVTFNGDIAAQGVAIDTAGAFIGEVITARAGNVDIDANQITTGAINATGGDALLEAVLAIRTGDVRARQAGGVGGAIDFDSTGGGALVLGNLRSDGATTLDSTGAISAGSALAGGLLRVGSAAITPGSVTFTGNASGQSVSILTRGTLNGEGLIATAGSVEVGANAIDAGIVRATGGDVKLTAARSISTDNVNAATVSGTGGLVEIKSTGTAPTIGNLTLGVVVADGDVTLDAGGVIDVDGIRSRGVLTVGNAATRAVTFGGNASALEMNIETAGAFSGADLSTSDGGILVMARSISAGAVRATGGSLSLFAQKNITTGNLNSQEGPLFGGAILIDSSDGGTIDLGNLLADTFIFIDTTGDITAGNITARNDGVFIGSTRPTALRKSVSVGDVRGQEVFVEALGQFSAGNITATLFDVDIAANAITTGAISSTNADISLLGINDVRTGALRAGRDIFADTRGNLVTGTVTAGGVLNVGGIQAPRNVTFGGDVRAGNISVTSVGELLVGERDPSGALVRQDDMTASSGGILVNAGAVTGGLFTATGGDIKLVADDEILTTGLTARANSGGVGGAIDVESLDGGLDLGTLNAAANIKLNADGAVKTLGVTTRGGSLTVGIGSSPVPASVPDSVTFGGDVLARSIEVLTAGAFRSAALASTAGDTKVDAKSIQTTTTIRATGGNVALTALQAIQTGAITATGSVTAKSTGTGANAGAVALGDVSGTTGITLDGNGAITTGKLTSTGGDLKVGLTSAATGITFGGDASAKTIAVRTLGGAFRSENLTSTAGAITVDARTITSKVLAATGNVALTALRAISTGAITATGSVTAKSTGTGTNAGAVALGDVSGTTGITLDGNGAITTGKLTSTGGNLNVGLASAATGITFGGDAAAKTITALTSGGAFTSQNLTSTAGDIKVDAKSIQTTTIGATGGNVALTALQGIGTGAVTATGSVTAKSTGTGTDAGAVALGDVSGTTGITLDGNGAITTGKLTSTGGDLKVGLASAATGITFGGDATAKSITALTSGGAFTSQNLTSTAGDTKVDAKSIQTTTIGATGGNVALTALQAIQTGAVTATGSVTAKSTGTGTDAGAVALGDVSGTTGITLDGNGAITTGKLSSTGGDLKVGLTSAATGITFGGDATAKTITALTSGGAFTSQNLTSTAGDTKVDAKSIQTTTIGATGGNVALTALQGIGTGAITATGSVTAKSTGTGANAGAVALGDVSGTTGITLDGNGAITTGKLTSTGGDLKVGLASAATGITFGGDATAKTITALTSGGAFTSQNLTSTAGDTKVDAKSIQTTTIGATGGNVALTALQAIQTGAITATGSVTAKSTGTGANAGAVALGDVSGTTGITLDGNGAITTGKLTSTGGDLKVGLTSAATGITFGGDAAARNIAARTSGAFLGNALATSAGNITVNAGTITTAALAATGGNVILTASGNIKTATIAATRSGASGGTIDIESTGGALDLGALDAALGIDLDASGTILAAALNARGGAITADARSIRVTGATSATGGDVRMTAIGDINAGAITATRAGNAGGAIDLESTGTGANAGVLNLGALLADLGIELDAQGAIATGTLTARNGAVDVDGGSIAVTGATAATGGNVRLLAAGAITTGAITTNRAIDIDSSNAGALSLGAMTATGAITLDTLGTVDTVAVTAGGNLLVGADRRAARITLGGPVGAANATLRSSGLVTANAIGVGTGTFDIEAVNIDLNGAITAGSVILASLNNGTIGLGSATGAMALTNTELGRISANTLLINAGSGNIGIAGVAFTDAAGRNAVNIATTGTIAITGNLSGTGAARTFRLGGLANGTGVASRIIANIDTATINLGTAKLDLRGTDIVFGQGALIQGVFGNTAPANVATGQGTRLSINDLVTQFVANAQSLLYTPQGLAADKVGKPYLIAGNMSVTYGGSALFQNSAARTGGIAFEGVKLDDAQNPAEPALVLNPLTKPTVGADARIGDGNVFSIFGTVNGKEGPAAALAGETVIRVNDKLLKPASRINGCIIGSAAGCVTTIIGNFVLSVPREVIAPIVAEEGSPLPFDPLVGTNNESLFSDAAPQTGDPEACRQRDANGVCVGN